MFHVRFLVFVFAVPLAACGPEAPPVSAPSTATVDTLTLEESASTNTLGYRLSVKSDGHLHWDAPTVAGKLDTCAQKQGDITVDASLVKPLFDDLAAAGPLGQVPFGTCAKPTSFRTTTRLDYKGASIADVDTRCPQSDAKAQAITRDTETVIRAFRGKCQPPTSSDASCPSPAPVVVSNGGTIARPTGSALSLDLVYQGSTFGIREARGVDMIVSPSDGPFAPGAVSGYWIETRSPTGVVYQHQFHDPTIQEAPVAGGTFTNTTLDRCTAKSVVAVLPNAAAVTELVVYGNPYGTSGPAVPLARFQVK